MSITKDLKPIFSLMSSSFCKWIVKRVWIIKNGIQNYTNISSSSTYYCPHCWGTDLAYGLYIRRIGHNPPRGPNADWWVLTTANAARTNGLTYLPKNGGARVKKFFVSHPKIDQCWLTSTIARCSALTAGPSSSSQYYLYYLFLIQYWRRRDESLITKRVMSKNVDGHPNRGRPKKRGMGCVKDDMRLKGVSMEMTSYRKEWKKKTCCGDPT
jgi:hypothetical protein